MKYELKEKYVAGSQMWFSKKGFWNRDTNLRGFGCGVVACMDFCVYKGFLPAAKNKEEYLRGIRNMGGKYFPIMPGLGIAPYYYTVLLNLFFLRNRIPYRVRKVCSARKTDELCRLLEKDLPVILCVGPTLPWIFKNKRISLYRKGASGLEGFVKDGKTVNSHYMTVVAAEKEPDGDMYLRVATWGEFLYMKLSDYAEHAKYTFPATNRFYAIW